MLLVANCKASFTNSITNEHLLEMKLKFLPASKISYSKIYNRIINHLTEIIYKKEMTGLFQDKFLWFVLNSVFSLKFKWTQHMFLYSNVFYYLLATKNILFLPFNSPIFYSKLEFNIYPFYKGDERCTKNQQYDIDILYVR